MGIDQDERPIVGAHEVFSESQQQAGLAATCLGDGKKVATQERVRHVDGYAVALMIGGADSTTRLGWS